MALANKKEDVFVRFIYRPLAGVLSNLLRNTGITPNVLSVCNCILMISSGLFFLMDSRITAGVLFFISHVIDCADGALARDKKVDSKTGAFFDSVMDRTGLGSFWALIIIGLLKKGSSSYIWMLVLFSLSLNYILISMSEAKEIFLRNKDRKDPTALKESHERSKSSFSRRANIIYGPGVFNFLMSLGLVSGYLSYAIIVLFTIHLLLFIKGIIEAINIVYRN